MRRSRLSFVLLLGSYLAAAHCPPAWAAGWHADQEAGIRLPLPFDDVEEKSGAQVTDLILQSPGARIPEGVRYTSGLYAKSGLPFLLIWTRRESPLPSRTEIDEQALDRSQLDRVIEGGVDEANGGRRSRVLMRRLRGQTVFVGLYYKDPQDGLILDQLRGSLEVEPDRLLAYADLSHEWPSVSEVTLVALLAISGGAVAWIWRQRARQAGRATIHPK